MAYCDGWIGQIINVHVKYKLHVDKNVHCWLHRISKTMFSWEGNLKRVDGELYEGDSIILSEDVLLDCEWSDSNSDEPTSPLKKSMQEKYSGVKATAEKLIVSLILMFL